MNPNQQRNKRKKQLKTKGRCDRKFPEGQKAKTENSIYKFLDVSSAGNRNVAH